MLNKSLFTEHLAKARNGVSGGISPTVEPKGAPSNQKEEGAGIASLPGAAAPGNHAGPGRPSGGLPKPGSGTPGGAGGGQKVEPCPLMHCPDGGKHHPDSAVMKEHTAQAQRTGDFTPAAKEANEKQLNIEGQKYDVAPHPREVALTHLRENKIGAAKPLSKEDGEAGVHSTFKTSLVGNGNAAMKPPPKFSDNVLRGNALADGASTTPANSGHKAEAAAFSIASSLGLQDHVPPTITRSHDGSHDMEAGEYSLQQWKDGHMPVTFGTADETMRAQGTPENATSSGTSLAKNNYGALIQAANLGGGKDAAEKMHTKLSEIAVLDVVMNNNDRHFGNIVMNPNRQDITAIDHGLSFGSGMQGHKNGIHRSMDQAGRPLIVPDHLHEQFKNRSLGDTERALDSHGLQPWQVVQTHLRQKYVAHLQDTHGYIPHEATRGVMTTCGGSESFALGHGWGKSKEADAAYESALADHQTPDQLFASFSKDYINRGLADKDNPAHADFVKMAEEMPAHQPGFAYKRSYQGSAQHQKYWDNIPAYQGVKCESFSTRFKVKQQEPASPVRTPPSIPPTRQGTEAPQLSPDSPEPAKIQKSAKMSKGLWINPSGAFPLTGSDLE